MKQATSVEALVAALIRFNEGAAHPPMGRQPPGALRIGEECHVFSPANGRVPNADLIEYLEGLTSPVLLSQSVQRGMINLTPLSELTGERRAAFEQGLANQQAALDQVAKSHGTLDSSMVALEFDEEAIGFTFAIMKEWAGRFILNVGWSVWPAEDGCEADFRLHLIRADGQQTKHFGEARG